MALSCTQFVVSWKIPLIYVLMKLFKFGRMLKTVWQAIHVFMLARKMIGIDLFNQGDTVRVGLCQFMWLHLNARPHDTLYTSTDFMLKQTHFHNWNSTQNFFKDVGLCHLVRFCSPFLVPQLDILLKIHELLTCSA